MVLVLVQGLETLLLIVVKQSCLILGDLSYNLPSLLEVLNVLFLALAGKQEVVRYLFLDLDPLESDHLIDDLPIPIDLVKEHHIDLLAGTALVPHVIDYLFDYLDEDRLVLDQSSQRQTRVMLELQHTPLLIILKHYVEVLAVGDKVGDRGHGEVAAVGLLFTFREEERQAQGGRRVEGAGRFYLVHQVQKGVSLVVVATV